jgi:hypothetical protein
MSDAIATTTATKRTAAVIKTGAVATISSMSKSDSGLPGPEGSDGEVAA